MILGIFFAIATAAGIAFTALGIGSIIQSRKARRQHEQATNRLTDIIRRES